LQIIVSAHSNGDHTSCSENTKTVASLAETKERSESALIESPKITNEAICNAGHACCNLYLEKSEKMVDRTKKINQKNESAKTATKIISSAKKSI
jgi:hypothetical protein